MIKYLLVFFLVSSGVIFANGKKADGVIINFFLETNKDPGKKLSFPWNTAMGELHFKRGAEFKTIDIESQRPFPSPHVDSEYGMMFKLDKDSTRRLSILTANNNGKHMIIFLNNKPLDMVVIDRQIDDGIICAWRGLSASDVHKADELTHRIGESKKDWKKRIKDKKN
ncbi:hypothetical protein OAB00_01565 [Akkermansiaceae bacterium]|nr:hypothetical protein [Akkermansiaceae bacterium]